MTSGSELRYHRGRDSSPVYQNAWDNSHRGTAAAAAARFVSPHRASGVGGAARRSSATETTNGIVGTNYPTATNNYHRNKQSPSAATTNPNGRHSMDVGVACRDAALLQQAASDGGRYHRLGGNRHHHYHHHHPRNQQQQQQQPPDDSVIMSRIKKSLEQKEEFLRRPVPVSQPPTAAPSSLQQPAAKEFYSRPQKLLPPVWPPASEPPLPPPPSSSCSADASSSAVQAAKPKCKQFFNTLGKIHEDGGGSTVAVMVDTAKQATSSAVTTAANMQMVSMRAKQFESGKVDDKTDFYKSELARLSSKHNVPNVAVRKMEYEQKLHHSDKKPSSSSSTNTTGTGMQQHQESVDESSFTSCSSEYIIIIIISRRRESGAPITQCT